MPGAVLSICFRMQTGGWNPSRRAREGDPEVGLEEEDLRLPPFAQGQGEVERAQGLALPGCRARDQDSLPDAFCSRRRWRRTRKLAAPGESGLASRRSRGSARRACGERWTRTPPAAGSPSGLVHPATATPLTTRAPPGASTGARMAPVAASPPPAPVGASAARAAPAPVTAVRPRGGRGVPDPPSRSSAWPLDASTAGRLRNLGQDGRESAAARRPAGRGSGRRAG